MEEAQKSELEPEDFVSEKIFRNLILPFLLLLVVAHLLSTFRWIPFLWGIHHLYFFPGWLRGIWTAVTLCFFIPSFNALMLKLFESILVVLDRIFSKIKKYLLFMLAGLFFIPLFWALRTKLFLLGDGYFKLENLPVGRIHLTELLDGVLHHQLYRLLTGISPGMDPSLTYTIPSVLCGGVFVFLILILSDLLGKTTFQKILIFSLLLLLGSIELFFGYVESYTFLLVGLTLFILFSILFVQGKRSVIFSFLALAFSMGIHVSAIVLVPSFLYIIFRKWKNSPDKQPDILSLLSLWGCLALIFLAIWKVFFMPGEGNRFEQFLPLVTTPQSNFTMFCGAHFGELVNQLLLVSPVGMILFLFSLYPTLKFKYFKDPVLNFLLISSFSGLFLIFIYNSRWGSADWDLRSFPGIFLTLFGTLAFIRWGSGWRRFKNYGLILMAVSLFHTLPWILVNASQHRSVDRYVMTTFNDKHILGATGEKMWTVGRVMEKAEEIYKRGIELNPRRIASYSMLGNYLRRQGKYEEAIFYLKRALELKSKSSEIRFSLGQTYLEKGDLKEAIYHLEQLKDEYAYDSLFVLTLSGAYLEANSPEEAKTILQRFLD
jgi:hypothetical protein